PAKHVFTEAGSYQVQVTARDKDGARSIVAVQSTTIAPMAVLPDPLAPGQVMLVVGGSTGSDEIRIRADEDDADSIRVRINEKDFGRLKIRGTFSTPLARIVVYAQAGDDNVKVDDDLTIPAWLYGGAGNDRL